MEYNTFNPPKEILIKEDTLNPPKEDLEQDLISQKSIYDSEQMTTYRFRVWTWLLIQNIIITVFCGFSAYSKKLDRFVVKDIGFLYLSLVIIVCQCIAL